jgi:hypothetical protein
MSDLWSQQGFPHKGWVCVGVADLGSDGEDYAPATCEACGKESIRYVHTMRHNDWDEEIEVGCVCAGKLEEDYEAARERETRVKNRTKRRQRWLTRKWRTLRSGKEFLNVEKHKVGVAPDKCEHGQWRYWIKSPKGKSIGHSELYESIEKAKLALFDEFAAIRGW